MKLLATEVALVQGSTRETVEIEISRILDENVVQREAMR
jgi:hypothetical protein